MQDLKAQKKFFKNITPYKDAALVYTISNIHQIVSTEMDCILALQYTLLFYID